MTTREIVHTLVHAWKKLHSTAMKLIQTFLVQLQWHKRQPKFYKSAYVQFTNWIELELFWCIGDKFDDALLYPLYKLESTTLDIVSQLHDVFW